MTFCFSTRVVLDFFGGLVSDLSGMVCLNNRVQVLLSNDHWFSFDDLTLNFGFKSSHFSEVQR